MIASPTNENPHKGVSVCVTSWLCCFLWLWQFPLSRVLRDLIASTGGFAGPGPQTITKAAQVQNALDDTTCTLEGNILERLSKNKYVFQDDSGKITVEIGQRIFGSNRVTPETRVRLTGEVDHKKQGRANEVDVRYLEIVK